MNAFEALCNRASEERWCWKLYCTTCGTMHLRYSLQEISRGLSPENTDWIINSRETHYKDRLGAFPKTYKPDVKENVLQICLNANVSLIAQSCAFPDWLGYLGFILEHMYSRSSTYKAVSDKWASELKNLVSESSRSYSRMSEIIENKEDVLTIHDLELIESDMLSISRIGRHN